MKILCIIQCSNLGGMEKAALESLSLLAEAGHEVQLFSLHPVGGLKGLAGQRGIPLSGTRKYRAMGLGNFRDIRREIAHFQPDRIWLIGHNFGSLAATIGGRRRTYLSIHYHHSERPLFFWRCFYGLARQVCRNIHFVSHYIYDEVSSLFPGDKGTCRFPNVLTPSGEAVSRDEARSALGLDPGDFVVGNAGWLIQRKAFDVFLQVAAKVSKQIPRATFLIAGDGPERERLEGLAASLGLSPSVRFIGWQEHLASFYGALDVLLFNSHFDCLGMTPLEALMHDVPVVCSVANGGLKELVRHGTDGILLDRHDTQVLAREIVGMHDNREAAKSMARTGRQHVLNVCSREAHFENLNQFLELE